MSAKAVLPRRCCANCEYFQALGSSGGMLPARGMYGRYADDSSPGDYGLCVRHAPQLYLAEVQVFGHWPRVPKLAWCGEFQQRTADDVAALTAPTPRPTLAELMA